MHLLLALAACGSAPPDGVLAAGTWSGPSYAVIVGDDGSGQVQSSCGGGELEAATISGGVVHWELTWWMGNLWGDTAGGVSVPAVVDGEVRGSHLSGEITVDGAVDAFDVWFGRDIAFDQCG